MKSHANISNGVFSLFFNKPHIGICSDVHLSATFFSEPFVHFAATQFPYPSKDALYKTEKKIIFHFQLKSDDISDILISHSYVIVFVETDTTLHLLMFMLFMVVCDIISVPSNLLWL